MSSPQAPREHSSVSVAKSVFMLFLVGGVAIVLYVLFQLAPPLPIHRTQVGATEERLRDELATVWKVASIDAPECEYVSKQFALRCAMPAEGQQQVIAAFRIRGWRTAVDTPSFSKLHRDRDVASITCEKAGKPNRCELQVRFKLRDA